MKVSTKIKMNNEMKRKFEEETGNYAKDYSEGTIENVSKRQHIDTSEREIDNIPNNNFENIFELVDKFFDLYTNEKCVFDISVELLENLLINSLNNGKSFVSVNAANNNNVKEIKIVIPQNKKASSSFLFNFKSFIRNNSSIVIIVESFIQKILIVLSCIQRNKTSAVVICNKRLLKMWSRTLKFLKIDYLSLEKTPSFDDLLYFDSDACKIFLVNCNNNPKNVIELFREYMSSRIPIFSDEIRIKCNHPYTYVLSFRDYENKIYLSFHFVLGRWKENIKYIKYEENEENEQKIINEHHGFIYYLRIGKFTNENHVVRVDNNFVGVCNEIENVIKSSAIIITFDKEVNSKMRKNRMESSLIRLVPYMKLPVNVYYPSSLLNLD